MAIAACHSAWDLVNLEEGEISREVFVNADIYQEELERIFARGWVFIGHESQVPKPDDYFITTIDPDSMRASSSAK